MENLNDRPDEFNQAINNVNSDLGGDSFDQGDPQEFFSDVANRLQSKYNIYNQFDQFEQVHAELLSLVQVSKLGEDNIDILVNQINMITGYDKLLSFLIQQLRGI